MKDNKVENQTKWVIEQMFSNHKKLRNEEKHFIETYETLSTIIFKKPFCLILHNHQTDRQNIYSIVAYIWEECL